MTVNLVARGITAALVAAAISWFGSLLFGDWILASCNGFIAFSSVITSWLYIHFKEVEKKQPTCPTCGQELPHRVASPP
jgi:hypothetical protein